jgi:hypothetical protein
MGEPIEAHIAIVINRIGRRLATKDTKVRPVGFKPIDRLTEILIEELRTYEYETRLRTWQGQLTLLLMQMPWGEETQPPGGPMWQAVVAERVRDAIGGAMASLGEDFGAEGEAGGGGLIVAP